MHKHNIAASTVMKCVRQVITAICCHKEICVPEWPTTLEKYEEYARQWAALSGPLWTIFDGYWYVRWAINQHRITQ
jgi:hypothetical protein